MNADMRKPLSTRERLAAYLVLLLVRIVAPWQFAHQFNEIIGDINAILKGGEE